MTKRMVLMLVVVIAFLGIIGSCKYFKIKAAMSQGGYKPPPEAVTTVVARQETWATTLSAIGSVTAVHGVTVSADLPGAVAKISFESGSTARAGDVLVQLDTHQEEAQLRSAQADNELKRQNLQRAEKLRTDGIIAQADYDLAAAQAKQSEAAAGEIRATIQRKTIRAPFAGVLGIRQVNLGQYLAPGDPVVPLQSLDPVYVDFSVPQQAAGQLHVGAEVHITSAQMPGEHVGRITALDSVVDPNTRNVKIQATLANPDTGLHPGMFVDVGVLPGGGSSVIAVPATAINHAPYGDSVFVVGELKGPDGKPYRGVTQQVVKLGGSRGDQVAVISGLKPGDEVATSGVFKLRTGAAVEVHNEVKPGNNPGAHPENS